MKDEQKWIRLFEKYKKELLDGRLRFQLADLENYVRERLGGASSYQTAGGYQTLYMLLKKLEAEGKVREIKSSDFNQRQPQLKKRWSLVKQEPEGWSDKDIVKLSRQLDLSYYLKRPSEQTLELKQKLFNLAEFLKNRREREWASREERSLELFGGEKYLSRAEGKRLLSSLNLSLADLKAQQYNHLFVYWTVDPNEIKNILIMENHSAFIGAKRALGAGINIFAKNFDTVIYGQGKKIIRSFSFLKELLSPGLRNNQRPEVIERLNIYYAGDLDPEGLAIYTSLKDKYPEFEIKLLGEYYQLLFKESDMFYPCQKRHNKNMDVLNKVIIEFNKQGFLEMTEEVKRIWENDLRLPQEIVTLEVYQKYFA
ncbi:MAG: Wadjet anti-phage system protein JetD domain-containing protein [Bacillota bacterium]